MENPQIRSYLGLPEGDHRGVVVNEVYPHNDAGKQLKKNDVRVCHAGGVGVGGWVWSGVAGG